MQISEVVGPRTSAVRDVPDPTPLAGEVVVDVLGCGVCTSDLIPWQQGGPAGAPLSLGHEVVGRVCAVGGQHSRWRLGDLVTGLGGPGFATKAVMAASTITPVPAGVDPILSIGEPLACLQEAISRCGLHAGDRVGVVGLGFMGLACIQLVRATLPGLVVGVDPLLAARDHAVRMGADQVFDPADLPGEMTLDEQPPSADRRLDLVIEATGSTGGLELGGRLVRPYGSLCVVGYHHAGTAKFDMRLWYKGATVINGFSPDRRRTMAAMRAALRLVADGSFDYQPLITHRFALDAVDQAYDLMERRPADFVKSVVLP